MGSTIRQNATSQAAKCERHPQRLTASLVAFSVSGSKRGCECAACLRTLGSGSRHTPLLRYKLCNEQKIPGAGCLGQISKLVAA